MKHPKHKKNHKTNALFLTRICMVIFKISKKIFFDKPQIPVFLNIISYHMI